MANNDFIRDKEGFRFLWKGMKTNGRPDSLAPGQSPIAINIRAYSDGTIQTRPGLAQLFASTPGTPLYPFLDIRAYGQLFNPTARVLAVDANSRVWLDNSAQVGTLAGGTSPTGNSMLPFRPNASPAPWMYIANGTDYQKFSAPSATNAVTQQKVGIAEPQSPPDAAVMGGLNLFSAFLGDPNTPAGTAGAGTTESRVSDTIVASYPVDAIGVGSQYYSLQVSAGQAYSRFQFITDTVTGGDMLVYDVFQAMQTAIAIQGIYYYSGTTGKCVIVPASLAAGVSNEEQSLYGQNLLSALRRGALMSIGGEVCLVLDVTSGPDGSVSFETVTQNPHSTADAFQTVPAIMVLAYGGFVPGAGDGLTASSREYAVTAGIGTMTVATSGGFIANLASAQPDDYIHISIWVDTLANLNEMKILLDVGDGSFTENFYYYTVRPSDIAAAVDNSLTQIGAAQVVAQRAIIDDEEAASANNQGVTSSSAQASPGDSQWSEILFPISSLTRVGNDQTKSLQTVVGFQLLWNANGTIHAMHGELDSRVIGGGQLDVGDVGAPYRYRVRARSSLTGAISNPSPATRYGVNPRRQTVNVILPSAAYDAQIDTWDVFRYGGAVTEWRFVGTTPSTNSTFTDNYDDSAAREGESLDFDNFEPWPTVDLPQTGILGSNGTVQSGAVGTVALLFAPNQNFLRYLPGTLVQLADGNVYTLWTRPVEVGPDLFQVQFVENCGTFAPDAPFIIQEPTLANQPLPYMWGPDASGTVFACGDGYRPGTVSFAKNYAPDAAPDTYNQEIVQPAEPLVGGEILDGLSFVASSERWWALYPQPQDARQRYSVIQQQFDRGLAAPYAHCTDGKNLYWVAKDGVYSSAKGSLTEDLYNLFPHEGIAGENYTYNGQTAFAPDYTQAMTFRLTYSLGYLYFIYKDSTGTRRMLTLDVKRGAWCVDQSSQPITAAYHLEQSPQANDAVTLFASSVVPHPTGNPYAVVAKQQSLTNDLAQAITAFLATNEFTGGDIRAVKQWGDYWVDCLPAAAVNEFDTSTGAGVYFTPMSLGAGVAPTQTIATASVRTRVPLSLGITSGVPSIVISDFLGLFIQWTDDYTKQTIATKLNAWGPSYAIQPAKTISWATFGTAYGMDAYFHIPRLSLSYVALAQVNFHLYDVRRAGPASVQRARDGRSAGEGADSAQCE